jgi:hypothetical protein
LSDAESLHHISGISDTTITLIMKVLHSQKENTTSDDNTPPSHSGITARDILLKLKATGTSKKARSARSRRERERVRSARARMGE